MVGFPALSCVFALAGVLVFGRFFLDKLEQPNGTPAKANVLLGGLEVSQAWVPSLCAVLWGIRIKESKFRGCAARFI